MSYKMIHLLCCILLLSTVGAIYPTNGVNITELKAKLNSLEAKFSVVLEEFYIERIARKELEQELNKTKLSLHIERIARKELEQELNLTKTSWSISFNDALQQVQQLKNTSNHMMQTLTSISNATMMQLHQMSISLLDTQNLQANFNKSQMEIQKELGQIESSLNTTYSNALKKMNELIRNVEVKLGENLTTMKAETNKTLQEHSVALLGVKQTVNQTMTEVSSLNSIYHDKFTKMNAFVRNSEEKLERNMTAMNTETNKKLQEHSVAILGVNHVANQTLMDLSFLNNSLMNELNNIYKSLHEQSVDMTGVKHSISGAKSSILSLNNTLNEHRKENFFYAFLKKTPISYQNTRILFDKVVSKEGSGYQPTTGVYTAPENGYYIFYLSIMVHQGQHCTAYISKNGVALVYVVSDGRGISGYNYQSVSKMVIIHLASGDEVWPQTTECDFINEGQTSVFAGFKLPK